MQVSQHQYDAIVGLAGRCSAPASRDLNADQRTLMEAATLARRGRYQDAENLLSVLPGDGPLGAATLDLKARVFAQQGRYLEAEYCWMEALRLSPANRSYRRALDCLVQSRHVFRVERWLPGILMAGLLVMIPILLANRWLNHLVALRIAADERQSQVLLDMTARQNEWANNMLHLVSVL